jgi:hypothetical protein
MGKYHSHQNSTSSLIITHTIINGNQNHFFHVSRHSSAIPWMLGSGGRRQNVFWKRATWMTAGRRRVMNYFMLSRTGVRPIALAFSINNIQYAPFMSLQNSETF